MNDDNILEILKRINSRLDNKKYDEILEMLRNIESRLNNIEDILYNTQKSARKMDEHIDFIDNVYDNVRKPFSKILTYYNGNTVTIEKKLIDNRK